MNLEEKLQQLEAMVQQQQSELNSLKRQVSLYEQCLTAIASTVDQRVLSIIGMLSTSVAQHAISHAAPKGTMSGTAIEYRLVDGETNPANESTLKLVRGVTDTKVYRQDPEKGWVVPEELNVPLCLLANKFATDNALEIGKDYLVNLYRLTPKAPESDGPNTETRDE